jgi:hypothetical protein
MVSDSFALNDFGRPRRTNFSPTYSPARAKSIPRSANVLSRLTSSNSILTAFIVVAINKRAKRWLTCPAQTLMSNAFNGSFLRKFVSYHEDWLSIDTVLFNDKLMDYLIRFNSE